VPFDDELPICQEEFGTNALVLTGVANFRGVGKPECMVRRFSASEM